MTRYEEVCASMPRGRGLGWSTGVAGFIGCNLLETLLKLDQPVVGLDNFATGYLRNLEEVKTLVEPAQWERLIFVEGDICSLSDCRGACEGVDYVLPPTSLPLSTCWSPCMTLGSSALSTPPAVRPTAIIQDTQKSRTSSIGRQ